MNRDLEPVMGSGILDEFSGCGGELSTPFQAFLGREKPAQIA